MQISKDKVASIHYTLRDGDGNILDTSAGREPLTYLQGAGNLIPGMEEGLEGKSKGDKFSLKIAPEKGYGAKRRYPRSEGTTLRIRQPENRKGNAVPNQPGTSGDSYRNGSRVHHC